jgi:hypothetical protein
MNNAQFRRIAPTTLLTLFVLSLGNGNVLAAKLGDGVIEPSENPSDELARAGVTHA